MIETDFQRIEFADGEAQFHVGGGAGRVPPGIGQSLLDDPVRGQFDARIQRADRTGHDQPDTGPRHRAGLVQQVTELSQKIRVGSA